MKTRPGLYLLSCLVLTAPVGSAETTSQKAREVFLDTATRVYADALSELPPPEKIQLINQLGASEREAARKLGAMLVANWEEAFDVSEKEAAAMLEGAYDDRGNVEKAKAAVKDVKRLGSRLPFVTEFLIKKVSAGKYHGGRKLDFAARVLDAQARKVREEMDPPAVSLRTARTRDRANSES